MTWMTRKEKYTCNYLDFCEAMGFGSGRAHGFQIHSQDQFSMGTLLSAILRSLQPPTISGMYYSYLLLAKIFRESLISKSGDTSECRAYHLNLMHYCRLKTLGRLMVVTSSTVSRGAPFVAVWLQTILSMFSTSSIKLCQLLSTRKINWSRWNRSSFLNNEIDRKSHLWCLLSVGPRKGMTMQLALVLLCAPSGVPLASWLAYGKCAGIPMMLLIKAFPWTKGLGGAKMSSWLQETIMFLHLDLRWSLWSGPFLTVQGP
jgi:hypothetical protein